MLTLYKLSLSSLSITEVEVTHYTDTRIFIKRTGYEHSEPRYSLVNEFYEKQHEAVEAAVRNIKREQKDLSEKIKDAIERSEYLDKCLHNLKQQYANDVTSNAG